MGKSLDKLAKLANSKPFKKGFTLTELLVVVLVLGVLAAIALPFYTKSVKRSRVSDALNNLNIVSLKQQDYMLNNEKYAETFKDLNVPIAGLTSIESDSATVGDFTYHLSDVCISAVNNRSGERYGLLKNVETQAIGCSRLNDVANEEDICYMFSDLVPSGSVGCEYALPGGDDPSGITQEPGTDCGDCTITCWNGTTITGICNTVTGECEYNEECPPSSGTGVVNPNICQEDSTTVRDNCIYTCVGGDWQYTRPLPGYTYNPETNTCYANLCPDGTVQKNTVDGVHYCRTYTMGHWVPESWTQPCE